MTDPTEASTTAALLARWSGGDRQALDLLLTRLYGDIHAIAAVRLTSGLCSGWD